MDIESIPQPDEELLKNEEFQKYVNDFIKSLDEERDQSSLQQNLSGEPEKLSNATHEIVFNITANVLEENEKGEKLGSKHICTKYYHIPVPLDGDYKVFMEAFFKFLESSLASAASNAYQETSPYKNKDPDNG